MEDNALILLTSIAVLALIYFLNQSKTNKIINLIVFIVYSLWMIISWSLEKDPSTALGYWFYLLFFNIIHLTVLLVQFLFFRKKFK